MKKTKDPWWLGNAYHKKLSRQLQIQTRAPATESDMLTCGGHAVHIDKVLDLKK